jgi:hypothetical protein
MAVSWISGLVISNTPGEQNMRTSASLRDWRCGKRDFESSVFFMYAWDLAVDVNSKELRHDNMLRLRD